MPGQIVVARSFCRFSRFDLKTIPVKRRLQALQLQLRQWAPFAKAEFAIVFEQNSALVWCWDGAWLQKQRSELPKQWKQVVALPESVLFPQQENGVRLLSCMDGVEAQSWQNGELLASRWWKDVPQLDDFIAFCREVGHPVTAMDQLPPLQTLAPQAQPWLPVKFDDDLGTTNPAIEQWFYAVLCLSIALPYAWYNLRQVQIGNAIAQNRMEMLKLTGQANALIQARQSALKAQEEIVSRQQLDPYPSQLDLMSAFSDVIPADASIREWEFADGKLRVVIVAGLETPSRADITGAILKTGFFAEVQNLLARDTKNLAFRMTVLPRRGIVLPQENKNTDEKVKNG